VIYRTASFSMILNDPYPHSLTLNIPETVRHYRPSFNDILIGTYTRPTQQCHFNCFYPLCSPLRGSWRPGHPSHQTTSRESSIQRRRSCGVEQFAAGHSFCINTVYFQKSAQDSSVFSFISIINLISRSVCCTAPL